MRIRRESQAPLNAQSFCTNDSVVRLDGQTDVALHGPRSRLGGELSDRIGLGRLRSLAFAERYGNHGLLDVGRAVAFVPLLPHFRGTHVGLHADSHDRQTGGLVSRSHSSAYTHFESQVSGDRLQRHYRLQLEQNDGSE